MDMRIIVAIVAFALPSMAEFSAAFHQLTAVRRSWWPTPWWLTVPQRGSDAPPSRRDGLPAFVSRDWYEVLLG